MESRRRTPLRWLLALAILGIVLALLGSGLAQIGAKGKVNFSDTAGNARIQNGDEFAYEILDDGRISFEGAGSPIYGAFKNKGLTLQANRLSGFLLRKQRALNLESATVEGAVQVVLSRPSASGQAGAIQEIELKTPKAAYLAAEEKWTLTGPVQVHRTDVPAHEDLTLKGSSAVVTLYASGEAKTGDTGIKTVHLDAANLSMQTRRREAVEGKPGQFEFMSYHFNCSSDKLDFDDAKRTITLTGSVHFTGDDPLIVGDMTADKAVVTLDEKGQPKKIQMSGEPGVTTIRQKPPPGDSRR